MHQAASRSFALVVASPWSELGRELVWASVPCPDLVGCLAAWAREPDRNRRLQFFSLAFSKIFILNDLSGMDWPMSLQNLEPQELTGKIFQNKDLAWERSLHIFSIRLRKILILNDLVRFCRRGCRQNLEPQGLTAKIFRNKDLAPDRRPFRKPAVANWLGEPSRMWRACTF
jgi:hypothetical protein